MGVGKAHSLSGEAVEVRRGNFAVGIVASHIAVSHIVGEDVDDVGILPGHGRSFLLDGNRH